MAAANRKRDSGAGGQTSQRAGTEGGGRIFSATSSAGGTGLQTSSGPALRSAENQCLPLPVRFQGSFWIELQEVGKDTSVKQVTEVGAEASMLLFQRQSCCSLELQPLSAKAHYIPATPPVTLGTSRLTRCHFSPASVGAVAVGNRSIVPSE